MMNLWKLSIRNTFYKPIHVLLTVLILGVSIGLLLGVEELDASFKAQFDNSLNGISMVVGAKGSPLQLVMSSLLHIDNPTGNISLHEAEKIMRHPMVKRAIPISFGDNFKGFRIVGTTDEFLDVYHGEVTEGRKVDATFEVVLGHDVAAETHLKIGDTFKSSHGLSATSGHKHNQLIKVVGVLSKTHTVLDKLIVTPLESIWEMHHHHHNEEALGNESAEEHEHDDDHNHEDEYEKEITSLLVQFKTPSALLTMPRHINSTTNMQAALPIYELEKLNSYTGMGVTVISWIAYVILGISCITFFANLFKMVKDRAFDLALLRTYGAGTLQLIRMVLYEGGMIMGLAMVLGGLLSQLGMLAVGQMLNGNFIQGISLSIPYMRYGITFGILILTLFLAVGVAVIPLLKMNISKIISNEKV